DQWFAIQNQWLAIEQRRLDLEDRRLQIAERLLVLEERRLEAMLTGAIGPAVATPHAAQAQQVGMLIGSAATTAVPIAGTNREVAVAEPMVSTGAPMVFNSYCWRNSRSQVAEEVRQGKNKPEAVEVTGLLDPREVHKLLETEGIDSWLDVARLGDGEPLFAQLVEALTQASVVVAFYLTSQPAVGNKSQQAHPPKWALSEIGFDMGNALYIDARQGDMQKIKDQIKRAVERHIRVIEEKKAAERSDAEAPSSLFVAIRHDTDSFSLVKRYLSAVRAESRSELAAISESDPFDLKNALHLACELGRTACVRMFLGIIRRGSTNEDRNILFVTDRTGASALFLACVGGHVDVVKVLLDGLPPDEVKQLVRLKNREFRTPLHVCAGYNHTEIAGILLNHGAEIDAVEANKVTPLGFCAQMGSVDVARLLLSRSPVRADPMAVDWFRCTVLHRACLARKLDIVKLLVDPAEPWSASVDLEAVDNEKRTPLIVAVLEQDLDLMRVLLATGRCPVSYRRPSNYGDTALSIAVKNNMVEAVELLLARGASIEPEDMGYRTPIIVAATENYVEIVRLLMEAGANVNHYPREGFNGTALFYAARNNHIETVTQLLSDPTINFELAYADDCSTPLLVAARRGHGGVVELLLKAGASPEAIFKDGKTFASACAISGLVEILKSELDRDPIRRANYLSGTGEGAYDEEGNTLLHLAVYGNQPESTQALLEWGADPSAKNKEGRTALEELCRQWSWGEDVPEVDQKAARITRLLSGASTMSLESCKLLVRSCVEHGRDPIALELCECAGANVARVVFSDAGDGDDDDLLSAAVSSRCLGVVVRILAVRDDVTPEHCSGALLKGIKSFGVQPESEGLKLLEIIKLMVNKGADFVGRDGESPLLECCNVGTLPALRFLLDCASKRGTRLADVIDTSGRSPLHVACLQGYRKLPDGSRPKMAQALLEYEKSTGLGGKSSVLFAADSSGKLPIDCALEIPRWGQDMSADDRAELVKVLLEHGEWLSEQGPVSDEGPLLTRKNKSGETLLMCAAAGGLVDVVRAVVDSISSDSERLAQLLATRDDNGNNVLHHAAKACKFTTVGLLLELIGGAFGDGDTAEPNDQSAGGKVVRAIVNAENLEGETPLCAMALKKQFGFGGSGKSEDDAEDAPVKAVRSLLAHGADPWVCSYTGANPLRHAINAGTKGASTLETVLTAMEEAVARNKTSAEVLESWKARSVASYPALHSAATQGSPGWLDILRRLLTPGAVLAAMLDMELRLAGLGQETALHCLADEGMGNAADTAQGAALLVAAGVPWWSADKKGRTPLWRAAMLGRGRQESGEDPLVEALCQAAAAEPTRPGVLEVADGKLGLTPLLAAALAGNLGSVRVLLRNGAQRDEVRGREHGEAFIHAVAAGGLVPFLEELLAVEQGGSQAAAASVLLEVDGRGWTPAVYAAAAGREPEEGESAPAVLWILDRLEEAFGKESETVLTQAQLALHTAAEHGRVFVVKALISRFGGGGGEPAAGSVLDVLLQGPVRLGTEDAEVEANPRTALARALGTRLDTSDVRVSRFSDEVKPEDIIAIAEMIREAGGGWVKAGDAALPVEGAAPTDDDRDVEELGLRVARAFESLCKRTRTTHAIVEHMLEKDGGVRRACAASPVAAGRVLRAMAASEGIQNGSDGVDALKRFAGLAAGLVSKHDATAALHLACESGMAGADEAAPLLVRELGADVAARVDLGDSPLAIVHRGHGLKVLVEELGADATAVVEGDDAAGRHWSRNALHSVRNKNDAQVVRDAVAARLGAEAFPAAWAAMLREQDAYGWEPLHRAVVRDFSLPYGRGVRSARLVGWLVDEMRAVGGDAGVDGMVNARAAAPDDGAGATPLHMAACSDEHARALLGVPETRADAATTAAAFGAGSALHALLVCGKDHYNEQYLRKTARQLVDGGVPVAARDADGHTPAEVADRLDLKQVATLLRALEARRE
ncbi:hypothetical protein HK405_001678, partial [Cladochytrium tenue]